MNHLERDFLHFLDTYGHHVLLFHANTQTPCSCYDALRGSADLNCPYCFGLGTVPVITKELTRDIDMRVPDSLPYIASQQLFGELAVGSRAYFVKKDVKVKEKDLLIDVEWQGQTPAYTGLGIYEVSHVDPARYIKGETVFQKVYVKDQPVNKQIRGFKIVERAGQVLYQMAEK